MTKEQSLSSATTDMSHRAGTDMQTSSLPKPCSPSAIPNWKSLYLLTYLLMFIHLRERERDGVPIVWLAKGPQCRSPLRLSGTWTTCALPSEAPCSVPWQGKEAVAQRRCCRRHPPPYLHPNGSLTASDCLLDCRKGIHDCLFWCNVDLLAWFLKFMFKFQILFLSLGFD